MRVKRLLIGALVAGSSLGGTVGVGAAANYDHANCIGVGASSINTTDNFLGVPGLGGRIVAEGARDGGPGSSFCGCGGLC